MTQTNKTTLPKSNWKQRLRGLLHSLSAKLKTRGTCGDQSDTATSPIEQTSNIIQSIKDLTLEQFITCAVDNDLTVLGQGTPQQLHLAWIKLQGQYYNARGDEKYIRYIAIAAEMAAISWRAVYIDYCLYALEKTYVDGVCKLLREDFPKFKFTPETYKTEIGYVRSIEKRNLLRYEELNHEYEQMQKVSGGRKSTREDYVNLLLDINKSEGASYGTDVTVEIFALCLKRMEREYENIKRNGSR